MFELLCIESHFKHVDHFFVTFDTLDALSLLKNEKKYFAHHPTNRNIKNFIKNIFFTWKILRREKPTLILSTGAGISVPFMILGRLLKIKTIYIESLTRIEELSLSAKMNAFFIDLFLVQWPELEDVSKKRFYWGNVL